MIVLIDGIQYIPAPIPAAGKDLDAALDVRFDSDAGYQITVRDFFENLLTTLWVEEEGFSGKRPWGNSGWKWEMFYALAKAGFIDLGPYHEENEEFPSTSREQEKAAELYCLQLIKRAFEVKQ